MKINKRRPAFEYGLIGNTKDLFGTVFEVTPVPTLLISWPTKKILKVNKATLSLLKVKSIETINQNLFLKVTGEVFARRDFFETEIQFKRSKGSLVYLTLKARKFEKSKVIVTLEDITEHRKTEKKLMKLAQLDGLTGLLNHKTITQRFKNELARAKRYHLPLSCLLFDVDNFKTVNDEFGHLAGDQLLKKIAQMLKINIRETDIVGRYGGDEFLIIMPETPVKEAWIPAKRIHAYFSQNPFYLGAKNVKTQNTFSIGISGFPLEKIETVKAMISHADKGLYDAKETGGNNIVFWTQ